MAPSKSTDAPEPQPPPRPQRGHQAKIAAAVTALRAAGQLLPHLGPGERDKLITDWLRTTGYVKNQIPTRWAIRRYLQGEEAARHRGPATS